MCVVDSCSLLGHYFCEDLHSEGGGASVELSDSGLGRVELGDSGLGSSGRGWGGRTGSKPGRRAAVDSEEMDGLKLSSSEAAIRGGCLTAA